MSTVVKGKQKRTSVVERILLFFVWKIRRGVLKSQINVLHSWVILQLFRETFVVTIKTGNVGRKIDPLISVVL